MQMRTKKKGTGARAPKDVEINPRAVEAAAKLGLTEPMRRAAVELAQSWSYEEAAKEAGVMPDIVRGWAMDPAFVAAVGWVIVGFADNDD